MPTSRAHPPDSLPPNQGEPPVANPKPRTSSAYYRPQPHIANPNPNPSPSTFTPKKKFIAAKRFFQNLEKPLTTTLRTPEEHQHRAEHRAEHLQRDLQKPEQHQQLCDDIETSETPGKKPKLENIAKVPGLIEKWGGGKNQLSSEGEKTEVGKIQKIFFDIFK